MKKLLFFLNLLLISFVFAKEPYYIMGDIDFSSYSGAEDLLSMHECLEYSADKIFYKINEKKGLGFLKRATGIILVWSPLSEFEIVLQHEVFGHGYRIRDIGKKIVHVTDYHIDAPFPYGEGGGATNYSFNTMTTFDEIAISEAGVESTAILANRLKMKWMCDQRLDPRKLFLYLNGEHDLTAYVYSMDDSVIFSNDGHDIESYLFWLNNTYYRDPISKNDLKKAVLINFVDPMTFYCFGSFFYYLFTGKDMKIPTIKIKNLRMLPNLRLGLAPYGLEYFFENFMSYKNSPIYSYFRIGKHNQRTFFGLGIEYPDLFKFDLWKIGFRCDLFRQPKFYFNDGGFEDGGIQFGFTEEQLRKMIFGVSSSIIINKRPTKDSRISFYGEAGYKTNGFVMGQALRDSFIFRLGLGFDTF